MIQRYSSRSAGMVEDESGEYVSYNDYVNALERMYERGLKDGRTEKGGDPDWREKNEKTTKA